MDDRITFETFARPKTEVVEIDNHEVLIRELTGEERAWFGEHGNSDKVPNAEAWLACKCMLQHPGGGKGPERMYLDSELHEVEQLSGRVIGKIAKAVLELSGLHEEAIDEGKDDSSATLSAVAG